VLKKLQKVIDKYQIPIIIDENNNFFDNAAKAREAVSQKHLPLSANFEIQKLEKELRIHEMFFETDKGKVTIQDFLDNGYLLKDNMIVFKGYIPIEIVSHNYNQLKFVDSKKFKKYGFGIQEFRIYLDDRIYDVYCNGKHPNLNPDTNRFCLDSNITLLEVTCDNVENYVKPMFSIVNMDFSYLDSANFGKVKELISE